MSMALLLVHSPLVGPSSWRPLHDTASDRGFDVLRPNLTGVAHSRPPKWRYFVDLARRSALDRADVVVIGHSGAGAMLPAIADGIGDRLRAMIFVDAIVPRAEGTHVTSQWVRELVDDKAVEGQLPVWFDWWPPEVIHELVPKRTDQVELRSDMPQLPRSFFDEAIPVPSGWSAGPCAYLKLSAAYDQEYTDVGRSGWTRSAIDGTHLSIFTDPGVVLDAIEDLVTQAGNS